MAKIIRKGHQLEEKYYAIKKKQSDKRAKNIRTLFIIILALITIHLLVTVISIVLDIFSTIFLPLTACIGFIMLITVLACLNPNISSCDNTDILVSGISGERSAANVLAALPDSYTVFQNVIVHYGGKKSEIDNIVVGKSGVFIIEVKNHNSYVAGDFEDTYWTQHKVGRGGTPYASEMYNPVKQVGTHIYCLANYLRHQGVNTYIRGMVFFVNKSCQLDLTGNSDISVYSSYNGGEDVICRQILSGNSNLDYKSINHICNLINRL